jgi:hypothetical protein
MRAAAEVSGGGCKTEGTALRLSRSAVVCGWRRSAGRWRTKKAAEGAQDHGESLAAHGDEVPEAGVMTAAWTPPELLGELEVARELAIPTCPAGCQGRQRDARSACCRYHSSTRARREVAIVETEPSGAAPRDPGTGQFDGNAARSACIEYA